MIRIGKGLLIIQVVLSALTMPLLFNAPLEMARMKHEARSVANHLSQSGGSDVAAQATAVADFLQTWARALPVALGVLLIAGIVVGLIGWQALNQKQKTTANQAAHDTARKLADPER